MDEFDPERDRDGGAVPWDDVRFDYEAGRLTCNGIAHCYKLRRGQLDQRARANKWLRPDSPREIDRRLLVTRLLGLLERQRALVETEMDKGTRVESKVLSDLVRDLDKLMALERTETSRDGALEDAGEAADLRRKLEARINAITKGIA